MIPITSSSSLIVLFLPIISLLSTTTTASDPLFLTCSDDNYTSHSPYASNLRRLLANLIATTPTNPTHLFTNKLGIQLSSPIYGLAECRRDASATVCADCLNEAAATAINGSCAGHKSATIRYDFCVLRFADHFFYSDPQNLNFTNSFKPESALNPSAFKVQVGNMLHKLVEAAASNHPPFAVNTTKYESISGESKEMYGLAWCTMMLPEDCYQCLIHGLEGYIGCCENQIGGCAATGSCILAYDDQPFFNLSLLQSTAPRPGGGDGSGTGSNRRNIILISSIVAVAILTLAVFCFIVICRRRLAFRRISELGVEEEIRTVESLVQTSPILKAATNNFSCENMLGEGRFGPAYKGVLKDGRQIVVNRLSKASKKGLSELKNEVALLAQLQHRNLVKLLGYCVEGEEKLLVYEYLPNASLDEVLFDPARREKLDWKKRYTIIEGIARGLLYLHNHSRLRIIHRDLNARNILLDGDMNPKISDFGLAKLVGVNESQWNTKQVAGTFGYMAPEYATRGLFSTKSDVYSYGMVVLEIVTGRRNCSFIELGDDLNLQTFVWQHWNEGKAVEVIDQGLGGQYQLEEVLMCLNIGLLCIQADPVERPSMSSLVLLLSSKNYKLPIPSLPAFFTGEFPLSESSKPSPSGGIKYDSF